LQQYVEKTDSVEEKDGIKWLHQGMTRSEFSLSF